MEGGDRADRPDSQGPERRLPYEKPRVAWEQPLEAQPSLMAGCQKTPAIGADCTAVGPISS